MSDHYTDPEGRCWKRIWADEWCDRTTGHKHLPEVFEERYGTAYEPWRDAAQMIDHGDASEYLGQGFGRVVIACDGHSLWDRVEDAEIHPEPDPRPDQPAAAETDAREGKATTQAPCPICRGQGKVIRGGFWDGSRESCPLCRGEGVVTLQPHGAGCTCDQCRAGQQQETLTAFVRACLGTGASGEPTPLEALQHLMDAFILGDRLPAAEWDAVERLARELRAAIGRAGGEGL